MTTPSAPFAIGLVTVMLACSLGTALADLRVNLSVKFILNADGTPPVGGIGNAFGFGGEVVHGNQVLAQTGKVSSLSWWNTSTFSRLLPVNSPPTTGST